MHGPIVSSRPSRLRQEWLSGKCCIRCGSTDKLEIDHINPALKDRGASAMWSWTKTRREVELAKCQILCRACHQEKTEAERTNTKRTPEEWMHGTRNTYLRKHCQCALCLEANNIYQRKWKRLMRSKIRCHLGLKWLREAEQRVAAHV